MVFVELVPEHGYALAIATASVIFVASLGLKVAGARSKAKVPYPYRKPPLTFLKADHILSLCRESGS